MGAKIRGTRLGETRLTERIRSGRSTPYRIHVVRPTHCSNQGGTGTPVNQRAPARVLRRGVFSVLNPIDSPFLTFKRSQVRQGGGRRQGDGQLADR